MLRYATKQLNQLFNSLLSFGSSEIFTISEHENGQEEFVMMTNSSYFLLLFGIELFL